MSNSWLVACQFSRSIEYFVLVVTHEHLCHSYENVLALSPDLDHGVEQSQSLLALLGATTTNL